jgi:hypothetical protein
MMAKRKREKQSKTRLWFEVRGSNIVSDLVLRASNIVYMKVRGSISTSNLCVAHQASSKYWDIKYEKIEPRASSIASRI